jgi:serine/threonine-protein kinase RsbW
MVDPIEPTARQSFPRTASCLPAVFDFMDRFFARAAIADVHRIPMHFVVEEWFTNLVKYSRGAARDILLELHCEGGRLMISLTDFDVEPFDLRAVPDVDVTQEIRDRKPGGLGIHLLKRMVDDIGYEYVDGKSTTTFVKSLEG